MTDAGIKYLFRELSTTDKDDFLLSVSRNIDLKNEIIEDHLLLAYVSLQVRNENVNETEKKLKSFLNRIENKKD
jgi:hypothetical protein